MMPIHLPLSMKNLWSMLFGSMVSLLTSKLDPAVELESDPEQEGSKPLSNAVESLPDSLLLVP